MAKRRNWISYEQAQKIVTEAGITSRGKYMTWHKEKGVKDIPKQPNRVYAEWDGWPTFLKTGNVFAADADKSSQHYKTYWEAVRWSQKFCAANDITTGQGWKQAYAQDRESPRDNVIPDTIPKHPESYYKDEWTGWPAWLGKHVREKLMAQQQQVSLLCLASSSWQPPNVITIVMAKDGEGHLLELLHERALTPQRVFKFDPAVQERIRDILQECGKLQASGAWVIHNVSYLISEISYLLDQYVLTDTEGFGALQAHIRKQSDPNPADGWEELEDDKYTLKVGQNSFI